MSRRRFPQPCGRLFCSSGHIHTGRRLGAGPAPEPEPEMIDELGKFVEEATKADIMLAAVGGPERVGHRAKR